MAQQKFSVGQKVYVVIDKKRYEATVVSYYKPLDLYDLQIFYDGSSQIISAVGRDIKAQ
jgi:hypothetical protein